MTYEKGSSSGALDAGGNFPNPLTKRSVNTSFNPESDWSIFDNVLKERGIPRQILIYPERYMDQYNVTRRKGAIKALGKVMNRQQLEDCLPFTWRYIRDTISNGEEPSLPGLGEKEADVNADGAQGQKN